MSGTMSEIIPQYAHGNFYIDCPACDRILSLQTTLLSFWTVHKETITQARLNVICKLAGCRKLPPFMFDSILADLDRKENTATQFAIQLPHYFTDLTQIVADRNAIILQISNLNVESASLQNKMTTFKAEKKILTDKIRLLQEDKNMLMKFEKLWDNTDPTSIHTKFFRLKSCVALLPHTELLATIVTDMSHDLIHSDFITLLTQLPNLVTDMFHRLA